MHTLRCMESFVRRNTKGSHRAKMSMFNTAAGQNFFDTPYYTLNPYGSKPLVSNEIESQLPSYCLSIHRAPVKLNYGVVLHGNVQPAWAVSIWDCQPTINWLADAQYVTDLFYLRDTRQLANRISGTPGTSVTYLTSAFWVRDAEVKHATVTKYRFQAFSSLENRIIRLSKNQGKRMATTIMSVSSWSSGRTDGWRPFTIELSRQHDHLFFLPSPYPLKQM